MTIKINKGFTLIELLVVVSIISMLSSMTFSFLGDARQKGRDTEKMRALSEVRKALQMYVTEKGYFPHSITGNELSDYIESIHKDIKYNGLLCNYNLENCQSYHLGINLERDDNKVLYTDSDSNDYFQGKSLNCGDKIADKDLCYDIVL